MTKFVYIELEGKGLDEEPIILGKGYLNIDYILTIPIPFSERKIEIHTGCIDELGISSGSKYYTLTKKTFINLLNELGISYLINSKESGKEVK